MIIQDDNPTIGSTLFQVKNSAGANVFSIGNTNNLEFGNSNLDYINVLSAGTVMGNAINVGNSGVADRTLTVNSSIPGVNITLSTNGSSSSTLAFNGASDCYIKSGFNKNLWLGSDSTTAHIKIGTSSTTGNIVIGNASHTGVTSILGDTLVTPAFSGQTVCFTAGSPNTYAIPSYMNYGAGTTTSVVNGPIQPANGKVIGFSLSSDTPQTVTVKLNKGFVDSTDPADALQLTATAVAHTTSSVMTFIAGDRVGPRITAGSGTKKQLIVSFWVKYD